MTDAAREEPWALDEALSRALEQGADEAKRKHLRLTTCVERGVVRARGGDRAGLERLFGKLVAHAARATEEGGVLVYVAQGAGAQLECQVVDTSAAVGPLPRGRWSEELFGAERACEALGGRFWIDPAHAPGSAFRAQFALASRASEGESETPRAQTGALGATLDPTPLNALRRFDRPGKPRPVDELVALFRRDAGQRLEALRAAVEAGDGPRIQREAHGLSGACVNVGARRASALAWWLEHRQQLPEARMTQGLLDALGDEWDALGRALDALFAAG